MSDYLLVAGIGLGGWSWGQTWGYMTAPYDHPPRLYQQRPVGKVVCINLAGQSERGADPRMTQHDAVAAITAEVKNNNLRDVVLVGHDLAASLVLKAAMEIEGSLKRVVLVGGVIPSENRSPLSMMPWSLRLVISFRSALKAYASEGLKLPKHVISNVLCSGMEVEDVIHALGHYQSVPIDMVNGKVTLRGVEVPCPISYVVLTENKLFSETLQRRMALRLGQVEVEDLESCQAVMLHKPRQLADILLRYA